MYDFSIDYDSTDEFVSINNETCLVRPTVINLNSNDRHYYPFMAILHKFNGSCDTLDDFSSKICVLNEAEDIRLNVFNMITRINESKT